MIRIISKNQKLLLILSFFIFVADILILLNIPLLRQIFGFLFLIILPGLLIINIVNLNEIEFTERVVLIVGISVSFLMFFGVLLNILLFNIGFKTPLATIPLLISFNLAFITLAIIAYKINKTDGLHPHVSLNFTPKNCLSNFNLSASEKAFLIVPILFPALSILGTHFMKTADNNIILMFLLFLIPIYVVFVFLFNENFPNRLYPAVILSISVSLLLIFMLRFPHICGHDVHKEYGVFFLTSLDNLHWSILGHSSLDACLSISLLPAIFQSIMNSNSNEYLFRWIYVSICSFSPLVVYVTANKYVDESFAFLASFFFISQVPFLITAGSPRTNVAIFFVALTIMVLLNGELDLLKRRMLFILFMLSVAVSHYATTYIFFFTLLFSWFAIKIFSRRYVFKRSISLTTILLFFAFVFFWYSQVIETAFMDGLGFMQNTVIKLNTFFIEESRAEGLGQLAGRGLFPHPMVRARFAFTWGTFILIGIGVLTMLKKYKEMVFIPSIRLNKPNFLKTKFEIEYFVMVLACSGLMLITVALPYISKYGIPRIYLFTSIIFSICFVIGGMSLSKFFEKHALPKKQKKKRKEETRNGKDKALRSRAYLIILLILIPYSMFQTGALYQIYGPTLLMILNSDGEEYNIEYIHDQECYAANWLSINSEVDPKIYVTDPSVRHVFLSQSKIAEWQVYRFAFCRHADIEGYIYLSYNNVVKNKLLVSGELCDMAEYGDMFIGKSKIYDNNCAEVHR